jgi:tetratricopeptide (TPR) repeat protein
MRDLFHSLILIILPLFILAGLLFATCSRKGAGKEDITAKDTRQYSSGTYVYTGREACRSCHEKEYLLYTGSDHDLAMDTLSDQSVLGNFDSASYTHHGITSEFNKKGNRYFVRTEGSDGIMGEFEIKYTFGTRPLQQYLVVFPGGRYQMLPLCWDTRPVNQGGHRWFHIYDQERIPPDDILFWTKIIQNWNYMCSECHSTNTRKQYDPLTGTYHTTWSEIDVSCEACHGPGSKHIEWADHVDRGGNPDAYPDMGLVIRLKDIDQATWVFDMQTGTAKRSVPRQATILVDMCARCHSRRSVMTENYIHGKSLLETHWPSLLEEGLYYPDGQIEDEVYEYASFLQSRMFISGVVCKDCHEPHSSRIYVAGNALCYRCHLAEKYGNPSHHFHRQDSIGSLCYECHMPERNYMVIDPRRDHSIRVPRPDLSGKLGTPNACNRCHNDKDSRWAAGYLKQWYGPVGKGKTHYGETFWAARKSYPEAFVQLNALAADEQSPPMVRATALALLADYSRPAAIESQKKGLTDPDPLIRYAAISSLETSDIQIITEIIPPALYDSVRLVRIMAARLLSTVPREYLNRSILKKQNEVLQEYIDAQMINADHPSAHLNLGVLYMNLGDYFRAEESFLRAIELEPGFMMSYINLADLYRITDKEDKGEKILRTALELHPGMSAVHHTMGLLLVRKGRQDEALPHLREAAYLEPSNARFSYVYGVALNSTGYPDEAVRYLTSALAIHPYDRDILFALSTFLRDQDKKEAALGYARMLSEYYPDDPDYRELLTSLEIMQE